MIRLDGGPRARRHRSRAEVERDSALPSGLFDCQEPMVEAALIDAAASVFLQKLGHPPVPDPDEPDVLPWQETVDEAAVASCLEVFAGLGDEPVPDLMAGLEDERIWVLIDLARHGTGVTRQRATYEVRELLRGLAARSGEKRALLRDLATQLAAIVGGGAAPVLFRALLLEARTALRCASPAGGGGEEPPW